MIRAGAAGDETAFIREMRRGLSTEQVLTESQDLLCYGFDAAPDTPPGRPSAVVFPRSTDEVAHAVRIAARHRRPIYARGAGTNLSGGAIPADGGLVLCFLEMNCIVDIDPVNLTATVQPGVVIARLDDAAAAHGLMYPPDPGSVATATMGGSVAECAGGLRGLKYGVTRDYVTALELVLWDGRTLRVGGKAVKNVTGYDLVRLIVGSEGTLAVITEITVRLLPRPAAVCSMTAAFADSQAAAQAAIDIVTAGAAPATLEYIDHVTLVAIEDYTHVGLPTDAGALLLIEVDGVPELVEHEAAIVVRTCRSHAGDVHVAADEAERKALLTARRAALPSMARRGASPSMALLRPAAIVEDATVPRGEIGRMLASVADVARRWGLTIGVVGHAGDGNLHPTIVADAADAAEMARAHAAIDEIFAEALRLGGTLSGEHGIGIAKRRYLPDQLGDVGLDVAARIKRAFDPHGLLNPGKAV